MAEFGQLVVFSLQDLRLSLPTREVVEIIRPRAITPIPGTLPHIAGIINLRGNVIPVVHLSVLCGLAPGDLGAKSRIVVVAMKGERIGLIVDDVIRVATASEEQPDAVPEMPGFLQRTSFRGFVNGEGSIIGVLHLEPILLQTH